jgi:PAS domain S-box-containing protein
MSQSNPNIPLDILVHLEEHMGRPMALLDKYNKVLWGNNKIQAFYPEGSVVEKTIIDLVHFFIPNETKLIHFLSGSYQDLELHGPVLSYEVKEGVFIHYKNISNGYKLFWISGANEHSFIKDPLNELDYKRIVHQIFDAIVIYNSDGMIIDANNMVIEMFKTERDHFIGKNIFSLFPHQSLKEANRIWKDFMKTRAIDGIYRYNFEDGTFKYLQFKARADFAGGYHLGVLRDVTSSHLAEKALKKSELQLRTVFNSSIYPIILLTGGCEIVTFNQMAANLGAVHHELNFVKGNSIWNHFPYGLKQYCEVAFPQFLAGKDLNTHFTLSDGNILRQYDLSAVPALDDKGVLKFICVTLNDVTEVHLAQLALEEGAQELKKMNFELDSFVYRASHDLRAPLRSVLGLINLIDQENDRQEIHKYVRMTEKSIQKLDTFILDLTNFSRNSRLNVSTEKIDFDKLLDEVQDNLQFMDNASAVHLKRSIDASLEVYSDPMRMSIIFQNILSNAYKYANKYSGNSRLHIDIKKVEDQLWLRFEDNGIGIKPDHIPQLFSMFFRASQLSYGSGLGLYITKQVVEKLGGEITVASVYNEGSTFLIKLPYN